MERKHRGENTRRRAQHQREENLTRESTERRGKLQGSLEKEDKRQVETDRDEAPKKRRTNQFKLEKYFTKIVEGETSDLTGDGGQGDQANIHGMNCPEMTENSCDEMESMVRECKHRVKFTDGEISKLIMDEWKSDQTSINDGEISDLTVDEKEGEDWKKPMSKTHKMLDPTQAGNPGCAAAGGSTSCLNAGKVL
jgi:hypothetical protein